MTKSPFAISAAALLAAGLLAACGDKERTAEANVGGAEAEVSTTLPESQVTDQQLQNTAEGAATAASTAQGSSTAVVVSPPATGDATSAPTPETVPATK